jgi:putative addiction module CopG family antidote
MNITLSPGQQAFIQQAIASGRFNTPEDALAEALVLWEDRERRRAAFIANLDAAEASLAAGAGIEITEPSMRQLADDVKARGRARLAATAQKTA